MEGDTTMMDGREDAHVNQLMTDIADTSNSITHQSDKVNITPTAATATTTERSQPANESLRPTTANTKVLGQNEDETLRLSSTYPDYLIPSQHLSQPHQQTPVELRHIGHDQVQPVSIYSFPITKFGDPIEAINRSPFHLNANKSPLTDNATHPTQSGPLLHSFSHSGRSFHDYGLHQAALEQKRSIAHEKSMKYKQQQAWAGQIAAMRESNMGHDVIDIMNESIKMTLAKKNQAIYSPNADKLESKQQSTSPDYLSPTSPVYYQQLHHPIMSHTESNASLRSMTSSTLDHHSSSSNIRKKGKHRGAGGSDDEDDASGSNSSTAENVIAMRRSRHRQRLAIAASASRRKDYATHRPRNPFVETREDNTPSSRAPLSHDAQMSTRQHELMKSVQDLERKYRAISKDGEFIPAEQQTSEQKEQALLHIAGVDSHIYKPSSAFSATTKANLHNPYFTEPSPTTSMTPIASTDPTQYLKRDRRSIAGREAIQQAYDIAGAKIIDNFNTAMNEMSIQGPIRNPSLATGAHLGSHILSDFLTSTRETNPNVVGGLGSKIDSFKVLIDQIQLGGVMDGSPTLAERSAAEIFGKSGAGVAPMSEAKLRKAQLLGMHLGASKPSDSAEYQQMEFQRLVGNNNSDANLLSSRTTNDPSTEHKSLTPDELANLQRMSRSWHYAVKFNFRSSRIRVTKFHLLYFFGTMPGCTQVKEIVFSPGLDEAFVSFLYNRFQHSGAGSAAGSEITGGRAGVECDGVEAVRLHQRIICADTPSPYLEVHRIKQTPFGSPGGPAEDMTPDAHSEMRVLLRFLLNKAHITEWSEVQMKDLKTKWKSGHTMAHVADPATLIPSPTLPQHNTNSMPSDPSLHSTEKAANQTATLMSQDTNRMFSPRSGHSGVVGAGPLHRSRKPITHSSAVTTGRKNKVYKDAPELQWPDGLFQHVNQAQAQSAYLSHTNGSVSARVDPTPPPPLPSNFLGSGAVTSRRQAMWTQSRVSALSAAIGSDQLFYPAPPNKSSITMPPAGTGSGFAPSSLATAPSAPPPQPPHFALKTPAFHLAQSMERGLTREPSVYTAHPSSMVDGQTRHTDPGVFVPTSRFFRTSGDLSNLTMYLNHPSAPVPLSTHDAASQLDRLLTIQQEQLAEEEQTKAKELYQAAHLAPVRNRDGQISHATRRRMKRLADLKSNGSTSTITSTAPSQRRVGRHLGWSLTAELEGCGTTN